MSNEARCKGRGFNCPTCTRKTGCSEYSSDITVKEIIDRINVLQQEKDEYASALKTLRSGSNWEKEIEKDGRSSVQTIYALYKDRGEQITKLLNYTVSVR